jgi:hypothetical protein
VEDMRYLIPILALMIPILGMLMVPVRQWLRIREREIEALGTSTAEKAAQYAAQTERLEQRVRVLERIVTDKGIDVAEEIERLRDRPLN